MTHVKAEPILAIPELVLGANDIKGKIELKFRQYQFRNLVVLRIELKVNAFTLNRLNYSNIKLKRPTKHGQFMPYHGALFVNVLGSCENSCHQS